MTFLDGVDRRRLRLEERHRPWRPLTLAGLLDAVADTYPDHPFVIAEDAALSYAEKADRSARLPAG